MLEEGEKLARLHPNIVVKCPVTLEGLKATSALAKRGIKVNVTLIFSPVQAYAAAKCGATYVSPFVGRLDDIGHDGMTTVEQIMRILRNYNYPAQVLVASLRNSLHVLKAAEAGCPRRHAALQPAQADGLPSPDQYRIWSSFWPTGTPASRRSCSELTRRDQRDTQRRGLT